MDILLLVKAFWEYTQTSFVSHYWQLIYNIQQQFKKKWVRRSTFAHWENISRDLATIVVSQPISHFSRIHRGLKDLHLLKVMNIKLLTNGRISFGLINLPLSLASICNWHKFGVERTEGSFYILYVLLSSLITFLSCYGALLVALINLL